MAGDRRSGAAAASRPEKTSFHMSANALRMTSWCAGEFSEEALEQLAQLLPVHDLFSTIICSMDLRKSPSGSSVSFTTATLSSTPCPLPRSSFGGSSSSCLLLLRLRLLQGGCSVVVSRCCRRLRQGEDGLLEVVELAEEAGEALGLVGVLFEAVLEGGGELDGHLSGRGRGARRHGGSLSKESETESETDVDLESLQPQPRRIWSCRCCPATSVLLLFELEDMVSTFFFLFVRDTQ
ncbi:uncharacterized protein M6B38_407800 [Iris pallida]|uniref:Uncharacterized protein n=1 Tax=Iris pallida TaxID=29817 RepID=A0AAX6FPG2_IRIPA|nr:uncharacterized protein M6B38_407800 [Iris pallida]